MKKLNMNGIAGVAVLAVSLMFGLAGPISASAATAPVLGTASDFAALGTAVTLTDSTVTTGDVGSTGAYTNTNSVVNGTQPPASDTAASTGYSDFLSAYGEVEVMSLAGAGDHSDGILAGSLDGVALLPGVYSFDISSKTGTLNLNANGDPNAVWIFKSADLTGYLEATNFSVVFLDGVGSASNVFWWTDAAATLTTSNLQGTILSGAGITITGGTLTGRALATAGVTVTTSSTVTVPTTPPVVPACSGTSSFDNSTLGSVDGQDGWSVSGPYDQAIVDNTYGYSSFGCKSLRLSNAITSGAFGDQTFSPSNTNEAGETDSTNGGMSGGTRKNHFEAQFDFASAQSVQQPGLFVSVSPDRGNGSRMSYLGFSDEIDGIDVIFYDVQDENAGFQAANFVPTTVATGLSRTTAHTAKFVVDYVDGPSNDIVKIYIDGELVHTGTTWENYFRFDTEASAEQTPRTTDDLLFRVGGDAAGATSGNGFLFDNVVLSSSNVTPSQPTNATLDNEVLKAADRLIALQNSNGSWDWIVTNATGPTTDTYYNISGVTALGLLDAYTLSNDPKYLTAAKNAGNYIVGTAISPTQSQNAYNVVFLQDLATVTASSTYSTKANDILASIFSGDNKWAHTSGNNCDAVTGCTPEQLVAAYANYRSSNRGLVPWDVASFVLAEVRAGNTSLAQSLVDAIVADRANYNDTAANYDLGLAGLVIAAAAVNDSNLSTYVAELVSRQHVDGSFGLLGDGRVQTTAYALRGLIAAGGNADAVNAAVAYISSKFGYSSIDGWKDTDGKEYAEIDSEAIHALFDFLPSNTYYVTPTVSGDEASTTIPVAITQSGSDDDVTVTAEIPAGTVVTGDSSWDGSIAAPTATTATVAVSGFDTTVTSAVAIGSSDSDLIFDKAVRLVFTGQAGTHVGWYNHAGTFTEITADCAVTGGDIEAAQTAQLAAGASCKMDVSGDLVVWTKHFTTFVTYTQTATPAPTPTPVSSGGGGGGIVGSGASSFGVVNTNNYPGLATAQQVAAAVVATTPVQTTSVGQVLGATTYRFGLALGLGSRGDEVTELQNRLTSEGVYSGPVTGYFGSLTSQAVKAFQAKYGIAQVGAVGPQTREKLNSAAGIVIPGCEGGNKFSTTTGKSCVASATMGAAVSAFTRSLQHGSTGDEVTKLQERLTVEGVYSGLVTGYFGSLTAEAVKRFQEKNGVEQVGVVGPQTRALLNR